MKRKCVVYSLVVAILIMVGVGVASASFRTGEVLYWKAGTLEKQGDYFTALDIYKRAQKHFVKEGNTELAARCRYAFTRIEKIKLEYSLSEKQVRNLIKKTYPGTTDTRIDEVITEGRLPHMVIGGTTYYFANCLNTLYHLYSDFRTREEAGSLGRISKLFDIMMPYVYGKDSSPPGRVLVNPLSYEAESEMTLPRDTLPAEGLFKVWLPLPLVTAAQANVEITAIYPEKYIRYPVKLDGDIGLTYMEIPLGEITGDLVIGTKFKLTHYEERFHVDPARIGEYDTESPLYKRYTASGKNIAVTPAIGATAKKIAEDETNPYRIAKKFYNHIVYDLDYSYTPHAALEATGTPESVFVNEHGYGDCGAQSMYFAALCRAMGIPARAPGGMQLFPNPKTGCGDHFWAQFYLPNYGWIPVDTSAGQLGKYMTKLTDRQKEDFIEYFFARMDPFRYLIQVDVDIPLIPKPDEPLAFEMVLQAPMAVCSEMNRNPGFMLMENWKVVFKQISGSSATAKTQEE